jgi:hypothetical protein
MLNMRLLCFHCMSFYWLLDVTKAQAATSSVSWTYPQDLVLTINVIDTIVVQWISNFDQAWLWLFCEFGTGQNLLMQGEPNYEAVAQTHP